MTMFLTESYFFIFFSRISCKKDSVVRASYIGGLTLLKDLRLDMRAETHVALHVMRSLLRLS
jgi:hypothetical protein